MFDNGIAVMIGCIFQLASEKRESLSIPMCSVLFGTSSIISSLDFSRLSSTELSSFCALLKTLLNPSILSVLQYAYSAVVATLKGMWSTVDEKD